MFRNKNILSILPRRNFLLSCPLLGLAPKIPNLIIASDCQPLCRNLDKDSLSYNRVLSFQINNDLKNFPYFIESFTNKILNRFGSLDLVTFHFSSFEFDLRVLNFFIDYSKENSFYVSISTDNPTCFSASNSPILDLVISPYGDLYTSPDNGPITLETDFGIISVHSMISKLVKKEFLNIFSSDILIINNYILADLYDSLIKMRTKNDNYLIYIPNGQTTSSERMTVSGSGNEIITQATSGINQGIIFHLENSKIRCHNGTNV